MFKRVTVTPSRATGEKPTVESGGKRGTSHWAANSGSEEGDRRDSPYRKSQTEEELLNIVAETRPKAQMHASPGKSSSSSYVSSPDRHRTPVPQLDRIMSLEGKLRDSTEKCKFMERQYRDLLTKHIRTEHALIATEQHGGEGRTTGVEEETEKRGEGTVEGMLRRVLEELRELKGRMGRIEETIVRVGGSL